jgi:GH15 family glucan-1,4-alpha-glucosidase
VRVTDALNTGIAGRLPWTELARRVDGVAGRVPMRFAVAPGTCLGTASPWVQDTVHGVVLRVRDVLLAVRLLGEAEIDVTDQAVRGTFTARLGSRYVLAVTASSDGPLHLSTPRDVDAGLDRTIAAWQRWSARLSARGPWAEAVERSALALALLVHGPGGSVAAAATTSLPHRHDGGATEDQRVAHIRDAAAAVTALFRLGIAEEAHAAVHRLRDAIHRHGPRRLYPLDGGPPTPRAFPDVPGWRGLGPVVVGNGAADELPLAVAGDVFAAIRRYVDHGHVLDAGTGRLWAELADRACDAWHGRDTGPWDGERPERHTASALSCWQALRCAVHLARVGQVPDDPARWAAQARRIHRWVHAHCWSEHRGAFVRYPGTDDLDAAILRYAGSGFDAGPRMSSTIDAVRAELGSGPLLYRCTGAAKEEAAMVAPSFWAVSALHAVGRTGEARMLMDQLVPLTNDVGVLAELIDPVDGAFLGNLPSAQSHLALIGAALDLEDEPMCVREGRDNA